MRLLVLALFFTAATQTHAACTQGLEAFKKTLYPKLVQSCSKCHGDTGTVARHSGSDPKLAYPIARKFADFTQIQKSKFYRKVMSAHWLDHDESEKGMTVQEMDKYLNDWWSAGEKDCTSSFGFESEEVLIPADLPLRSSGTYKKLSWDLGKAAPTFKGCEFGVEGQVFREAADNIPRSYRFRLPTVKCPSGTMTISKVRLLLDGDSQAFENIYDDVQMEIKHNGSEVVLSDELLIMIASADSGKKISLGMGELKLKL